MFTVSGSVAPNAIFYTIASGYSGLLDSLGFTLTSYGTSLNVDNLVLSPAAPVPEPQTYAMLLIGLGLIGFMARRREDLTA